MARKITIGYFLEDAAHERFLRVLVHRIAISEGFSEDDLNDDVRNAVGGATLKELKIFLHDYAKEKEQSFDVLIAAVDGNCLGYLKKRQEIEGIKSRAEYPGNIVCAVPNPHIELWYMIDQNACQLAIGSPSPPVCPKFKCEKDRYKTALKNAILASDAVPLLGGAEFGGPIAGGMNISQSCQADQSFGHFVTDLRDALAVLKQSSED